MVGRSQSIVVLNGESEQIVLVGSVRVRACCLRGGGGDSGQILTSQYWRGRARGCLESESIPGMGSPRSRMKMVISALIFSPCLDQQEMQSPGEISLDH